MGAITKEMTVNEVLKLYPATISIFNKFNIDACCGGNRSLEQAAREDGANIEELIEQLNRSITSP